jgi:hypothetical protein
MESFPMAGTGGGWSDHTLHPGLEHGLQRLYQEYRRREAGALLSLLPPEAVRPLYRLARERMAGDPQSDTDDPLALLVAFVERHLLPLPPFEVWRDDFRAHRSAHLQGLDVDPRAPEPGDPVTVEVRSFRRGDGEWYAGLSLFRRESVWWGFLAFSRGDGVTVARTADIFREERPEAIRDRFRSFGADALQAFLRSTLP